MDRYGILQISRLADIIIHVLANTDNWSDVYVSKFHMILTKFWFQKH